MGVTFAWDLLPKSIAQEIVDDLQAALSEFAAVAEALEATKIARQEGTARNDE